ncbi:MAG: sugar phosphate isomerase/epimerase [Bacteroidaceae bacterium]|nr:sugar phosphate isomerase/epimerase [Bacteroidaceae bacterium]
MRMITLLLTAFFTFLSCSSQPEAKENKISVFAVHINSIAQQEHISFLEAATKVRQMGYAGADVYPYQEDIIPVLDSLGFGHSCAIVHVNYLRDEHVEGIDPHSPRGFFSGGWGDLENAAVNFVKKYNYPHLMLVPEVLPKDATPEDVEKVRSRVAAFADRCVTEGIDLVVESFDNEASLCYGTQNIQDLLSRANNLGVAFDIGNFTFAKEDPVEAYELLKDKVRHVHIKDRASLDDMTPVPAGTGCSKIATVLHKMQEADYDGWYTVEVFGSKQMSADLETAYRNTYAFLYTTASSAQ